MKKFLNKFMLMVAVMVVAFSGSMIAISVNNARATAPIDDTTLLTNIKNDFVSAGWTPPGATTPPPAPTGVLMDAWVYPGAPSVATELADGRQINMLKVEFGTIKNDGAVEQTNVAADMPNAYSPSNVAMYKQHSQEQCVTISGNTTGTTIALANPTVTQTNLVNIAQNTGINCLELDFEGYGEWSAAYYNSYKTFTTSLANTMHARGGKLLIVGPPISNATSQGWYQFKYEDFATSVDQVIMMIYDAQYDNGVGTSIQPAAWSTACMNWLKSKVSNGVAGIPSYGYKGTPGTYNPTVGSSTSMTKASPTRNADGELTKTVSGVFYDWSDVQTMNTRIDRVKAAGFNRVSIWSLGNNPWPTTN